MHFKYIIAKILEGKRKIFSYALIIVVACSTIYYQFTTDFDKQTEKLISKEEYHFIVLSWNGHPINDRMPHALGRDSIGNIKEYKISEVWQIRDSVIPGDIIIKKKGSTDLLVIRRGCIHKFHFKR